MAIEVHELGSLTAEFMSDIEGQFGESASLGVVAVVVEIDVPGEDSEHPGYTEILYRCSDQRRWVQQGFFQAAKRAVFYSTILDDDEEEE